MKKRTDKIFYALLYLTGLAYVSLMSWMAGLTHFLVFLVFALVTVTGWTGYIVYRKKRNDPIIMTKKKILLLISLFLTAAVVLFFPFMMDDKDALKPWLSTLFYILYLLMFASWITFIGVAVRERKKKKKADAEKAQGAVNVTESAAGEASAPGTANTTVPIEIIGTDVYLRSDRCAELLFLPLSRTGFNKEAVIMLTEKEPAVSVYDDGVKTREYRLYTENGEDHTNKYFHISVRMIVQGQPAVPVVLIDGFISDDPNDTKMASSDIGYRFEVYFMNRGGEEAQQRRNLILGQDLQMKALRYQGFTTPRNVRLVGFCPVCKKSFAFYSYAYYMIQNDVAYSDDGLDVCNFADTGINKNTWKYEVDGKTFRYYNSFNCIHCGTPYIDYNKYRENKVFGVAGCVHLGRKPYTVKGVVPDSAPDDKAEKAADQTAAVPDPAKIEKKEKTVSLPVICVKCGKTITDAGDMSHMGSKYYCRSCYDAMYAKVKETRERKREQEAMEAERQKEEYEKTLSESLKNDTDREAMSELWMTSQHAVHYVYMHSETHRLVYMLKLRIIGFTSEEAEKLFAFECDIAQRYDKKYMLSLAYTKYMWYMDLQHPFFDKYPKEKDDILKEHYLLFSEICKIIDEAEWHYWNSHEKEMPDEVWKEIYEWHLKGKGGEYAGQYFKMISECTGIPEKKLDLLCAAQGKHLSTYKWH